MDEMPLIGISGSMEGDRIFLLRAYFSAIASAGGIPVLLDPDLEERAVAECVRALDGLLLAGGGDVEPHRFGETPIPELGEPTPVRDGFEIALLEAAASRDGMPVLGICRGLQVMNVAAGGTLYQDLPSQHPGRGTDLLEHKQTLPYEQPSHSITLQNECWLYPLCGQAHWSVNSMHHQAIHRVAPAYQVVATSPDGVVEAIQHRQRPHWQAVQWHPERLSDGLSKGLFATFVQSAQQYRRKKA